jgi:hypothetical protein
MAEYIGYRAADDTQVDWAKLTGGLVSTIKGIETEREAEKAALDKLASDNIKILQNTELGKTQTFDHLILGGSNMGRDKIFQWNKQLKNREINPVQYRNRINNLKASWSTFANTAKAYDQQMAETLKRQQANEKGFIPGSELEATLNQRMAEFSNLRNKTFAITEDGEYVLGEFQENGILDPTSIIDLRAIANPSNIIDNRIDLDGIVDAGTKNLSEWTEEKGDTTTTDPLLSPYVQEAVLDLSNGILNNPRAISGVLTGHSGGKYDYYFDGKDLDSKLQERVAKKNEINEQLGKPKLSGQALNDFINSERNKFILLAQDNQSVYQPNLTEDQVKEAKKIVLNRINSRLERKVTTDEPYRGGGGGGSRGGGGGEEENVKQTSGIPERVYGAWDNVESLGSAESQRIMSQASGGQYSFKWEKENGVGGVNVYKKNPKGELEKQNLTIITNPKYLSKYFGYNPDKWTKEGKRGVGQAKTYSSAQETNIKATLKANPGATRQQAIEALGY